MHHCRVVGAAPIDEIRALDEKFNKLPTTASTKPSLVRRGCRPHSAHCRLLHSAKPMAEFFKEAFFVPPITNLNLQPVSVQEDSSGMTRHEIGNSRTALSPGRRLRALDED